MRYFIPTPPVTISVSDDHDNTRRHQRFQWQQLGGSNPTTTRRPDRLIVGRPVASALVTASMPSTRSKNSRPALAPWSYNVVTTFSPCRLMESPTISSKRMTSWKSHDGDDLLLCRKFIVEMASTVSRDDSWHPLQFSERQFLLRQFLWQFLIQIHSLLNKGPSYYVAGVFTLSDNIIIQSKFVANNIIVRTEQD